MPIVIELILVEFLLLDTAAEVDQECNETGERNKESNDLPVEFVASIKFFDILLDDIEEDEPKSGGNQILDGDAPVEDKVLLVPLFITFVRAIVVSSELGHRVSNSADTTHDNSRIPVHHRSLTLQE